MRRTGVMNSESFRDDLDYKKFLTTLTEACIKTDWQLHAYCLMGNHGARERCRETLEPV